MKLTDCDIEWLKAFFPSLVYDQEAQRIVGELDFCACFDNASKKMQIEGLKRDEAIRNSESFLRDVFEIEILLDVESVGSNGWPQVHEVGGRYKSIAEKYDNSVIDLHLYANGACCLGIRYSPDRNFTIQRFLYDLVIPFFYRLSYTDLFGIEAARNNLWGEYPHGDWGLMEHGVEMLNLSRRGLGRNEPCPCGSGRKYKKCCLDEVEAMERKARLR